MTLTGNNVITLRKLTLKVTAEKGIPLSLYNVLIYQWIKNGVKFGT